MTTEGFEVNVERIREAASAIADALTRKENRIPSDLEGKLQIDYDRGGWTLISWDAVGVDLETPYNGICSVANDWLLLVAREIASTAKALQKMADSYVQAEERVIEDIFSSHSTKRSEPQDQLITGRPMP